jgi:hypothetical protein
VENQSGNVLEMRWRVPKKSPREMNFFPREMKFSAREKKFVPREKFSGTAMGLPSACDPVSGTRVSAEIPSACVRLSCAWMKNKRGLRSGLTRTG